MPDAAGNPILTAETKALADTLVATMGSLELKISEKMKKQDEEIASLGGSRTKTAEELKSFTTEWEKNVLELKKLCEEAEKKHQDRIDAMEAKMGRGGLFGAAADFKTPGQMFVEAEGYKSFKYDTQRRSDDIPISSPWQAQKDITGVAALRDVLSTTRVMTILNDPIFRVDHVRDFMTVINISTSAIDWAREDSFTNNAGPQSAEGAAKPLSAANFSQETSSAKTLAHGLVITRQLLADVRGIQQYLDNRLLEGLKHVEDMQILFGDGQNGALLGIWNTPGVAWYNRHKSGDTMIDQIRRTQTQIKKVRYMANLTVLSLEDWEAIELLKDGEERYLWVQVQEGGTPRLWRTPIIDTDAMPEGRYLQGDFRNAATLYDREAYTARLFDQYDDHPLKNLLLLLAEGRLILTVEKPKAFVKGRFGMNGSGS